MLLHTRNRTVKLVRLLGAAGPLPRRRRIPKQQQPDLIRKSYFTAIMPYVDVARRAFAQIRPEILRILADNNNEKKHDRLDADDRSRQAERMISGAASRASNNMRPRELEDVARKFGRRTSDFQREQLDRQVRSALAVPLSLVERPITNKIDAFAKENVDLIVTVPDRYFARIQERVQEAFIAGSGVDDLTQEFVDIDDMAENDARRIARDQIGKLAGELNQDRQEEMGVTQFQWSSMEDERVRDEHAELDGQIFSWDDPPINEKTGEEIIPGSEIMCRCFATPLFDDILQDVDD